MRRSIAIFGSLKLTVALLLVILVVLAVGTIIESLHGAERARAVYGSSWFYLLLGAFSLNLTASLIDRWPYGRFRIGFVITHLSMILIFAGALTTLLFKVEGRIGLWEGQQTSTVMQAAVNGEDQSFELPFTVRLDDFEIDVYPGTSRPAMFRSRITVLDGGSEQPAVIEMNKEHTYAGFSLYQSSYRISNGREASVMQVSRDPGQIIVFAGYVLLVVGMLVVLATRIIQRRQKDRPASAAAPVAMNIQTGLVVLLLVGSAQVPAAASPTPALPDQEVVDALRLLPVQHDGRVMPLDTLARESVWQVTGKTRWNAQDPVATVVGWITSPMVWADEVFVPVGGSAFTAALGLDPGVGLSSYNSLLMNLEFRKLADAARNKAQAETPLTALEEDAQVLEGRLTRLHEFLTRQIPRAMPLSNDPSLPWGTPPEMDSSAALVALGKNLAANPPVDHYPSVDKMKSEARYNMVRPTRLAWFILLPASIAAAVSWRRPRRDLDRIAAAGLLIGFAVMTWGIAMRWIAAERIPASNMYESLLFLAWGVGLFAFIAALFIKDRLVIFNAGAMSTLAIMLTDLLPMDPFIHPMPPVLAGTAWLAIHVPIIMVSYALLGLAALVAHMRVGAEIFSRPSRETNRVMDDIHYWYVQIGSIMLIVGILTGSIWAASSWGRYWGWDPKEVWSLIAFLAYMAILHGRIDKWLGSFWVAVASIMAFGTILMTYIGVNYVLAAGLHSYGFGGSKVANWLMLVAVAEVIFIIGGVIGYRRNRKDESGGPPVGIDPPDLQEVEA